MREYRIIIANRPAVHKSAHRPFSKNTKNRVCQLVFFLTVWRIGFTIKHSIIPAVTEPVPMVSTAFFKGIIMNRQFRCGLTEPHFSFDSAKPWFFRANLRFFGVFCLYSSCSAHACCACFTVESACFLPNCRSIEKQHRRSAVLSWVCAVSRNS